MKTSKMNYFLLLFVISAFLVGSLAFAGGKPAPTYSWSVYVPIEAIAPLPNVQGVDPTPKRSTIGNNQIPSYVYEGNSTTNNVVIVSQKSSAYSLFGFEVFYGGMAPQPKLSLDFAAPFVCADGDDCSAISDVIQNDQPDGGYGKRIFFQMTSPIGYLYDQQTPGTKETLWGYFIIDNGSWTNHDQFKNYIKGTIHHAPNEPCITVERIDDNIWHISGNCSVPVEFEQKETTQELDCNGRKCQLVDVLRTKATGTASPMNFEFYFERHRTN